MTSHNDAPCAFQDAFHEDLCLWKACLNVLPDPEPSSWIFHDLTTLLICEPDRIQVIKANGPTLGALAMFDIFYHYWEVDMQKNVKISIPTRNHVSYHRGLRNKILSALIRSAAPRQQLDFVIGPWLLRTLCLCGHDEESREEFDKEKRPSYLIEKVIDEIINHVAFKRHMSQFAIPLAVGQTFQCATGKRSWEYLGLGDTKDTRTSEDVERMEKGIFFFPCERLGRLWDLVRKNRKFRRQGVMGSESIVKLEPEAWLNDEIINGYINLLDGRKNSGAIVFNTFFFTQLSGKRQMTTKQLLACFRHKKTSATLTQAIQAYDQIIIPINWENMHWLTAVLDVKKKKIIYMDSLPENNGRQHEKMPNRGRMNGVIQILKERLSLGTEWATSKAEVPIQKNDSDCGVFCAQFIKFIYFQRPIPAWGREDMVGFRNMMTIELYEQRMRWFSTGHIPLI